MHLHTHVPVLLDMIRDQCITQYVVPYSCVSIEKMGRVFGYTACDMESIVAKLLLNGELLGNNNNDDDERSKVRINSHDGTLIKETATLGEMKAARKARVLAMKMGRQFTCETEGVLLRVMCMESGLVTQQSLLDNKRSSGWRSSNNRVGEDRPQRDVGSGRNNIPNESMGSDLSEESEDDIDDIDIDDDDDGSISHDDMDVDNHNIVNPNEY